LYAIFKKANLEKEDDFIRANPNSSDSDQKNRNFQDGICNIRSLSEYSFNSNDYPERDNKPIVDLDPSTTHRPGFGVNYRQYDQHKTKNHENNQTPLKSIGGKRVVAKYIESKRSRQSLNLKLQNAKVVELPNIGRTVVLNRHSASRIHRVGT